MEEIPLKGTAGSGAEQVGTKPKPASAARDNANNNNENNNNNQGTEIEMMEQDLEMDVGLRDGLDAEGYSDEWGPSGSGEGGNGGNGGHSLNTTKKGLRCGCLNVDPLLQWTLVGVALGMVLGFVMNQSHASESVVLIFGFPGKVFLNLLKMLVLPLLSLSIMCGVASLSSSDNKTQAGRVTRLTVGYYLLTTTTAVLIGVAVVNIIRPGYHSQAGDPLTCHDSPENAQKLHPKHDQSALESILQILEQAFPSNIVDAAAKMNVLGVVTFSIFFGFVLSTAGEDGKMIVKLIEKLNRVVTRMVEIVLRLTPLGVFSLIASSIARACDVGAMAQAVALYMVTVAVGLGLQGLGVLPFVYSVTTRRSPLPVLRAFLASFVTAFGTDSSSATLPVTIRCAKALGLDPGVINFVLPLGATVNMNGTALYEALTVIFIAQRHNVVLDMGQTFIIIITGTMAAVGAAAIPSAGLVTMLMVLQAVNLSEFATDIALVITVDWLLDRLRTVVNVEGDAFGVAIVHHFACGSGSSGNGGGLPSSTAPSSSARRLRSSSDANWSSAL